MVENKNQPPNSDQLDWIPLWVFWMGGSLFFLMLVLWAVVAPDWCLVPLVGGGFFAYFRFKETPVYVLGLVLAAILLTSFRVTPDSIFGENLRVGTTGDHLGENWVLVTLIVMGLLGCSFATQQSAIPKLEKVLGGDIQSWLIQLVWIFVPALFLTILAYKWILGEPDQVLIRFGIEMDISRARFLGLAFFGGGGLFLFTLFGGLFQGSAGSTGSALAHLYEISWRQTRREQSRIQQWLVKSKRLKG